MSNMQNDLREISSALRSFLRHPVQEIKRIPHWEWRRVILAQVLVTMTSGALAGLIHHSVGAVFMGLILTPILTLITTLISSLFFYYTFQIVSEKALDFKLLFTAVFFANVPFFVFQIISGFFPPILLIGLAFTAMLLVVALVENFELPRKFTTRLILTIYLVFVATYAVAWWTTGHSAEHWHSAPENDVPEVHLGE
jgi:hypothetical protein